MQPKYEQQQVKKDPNDPDADKLNKEIVAIAALIGFMKQPMMLYLSGKLTWMETLEIMVILMAKEYREQKKILIDTLLEKGPEITLMLNNPLLSKALPQKPLEIENREPANAT